MLGSMGILRLLPRGRLAGFASAVVSLIWLACSSGTARGGGSGANAGSLNDGGAAGTNSGGASAGGSAGNTGPTPDGGSAACIATCQKQAEANCSESPARENCNDICVAILADAECGSAYPLFAECGATEARFECTDTGKLAMYGCWGAFQPYIVCGACRSSTSDDPCEACKKSSCCAETKAFWGHPDLDAFNECGSACAEADGGTSCLSNCMTNYPSLAAAIEAHASCPSQRCAAACT
jgi:hypothetical protein